MRQARVRHSAFTLIELLVVVSIIALLISILLPSISRSRELAKTVKCLANLKSVGAAMHMYFADNNNWFPFHKDNNLQYLHGFYYGGHPGRPGWWGYEYPEYKDTPRGRPFNRYMYPDLPNYNISDDDEANRKMPVYECPSDRGPVWGTEEDDFNSFTIRTTYWQCGSSYDLNYHFALHWAFGFAREGPPPDPWLQRANHLLSKQLENNSARFIMLYEDAFDSAQWNNIPRRGWHGLWNRHSFLFLDGHAANQLTDTLKGNSGVGWKSLAGSWYSQPQDPDYPLRFTRPR